MNFITESEKTFDLNGSFEFAVSDEAGNVANVTATVNYIDKINPVIVFESTQFDSKKHKNATVKVSADDANGIAEVQYAVVKTGDEAGSYIACQNGEEINIKDLDGTYEVWVKATDSVGNTEYRKSQSLLFDNTVPEPSVSYEPSSRTARDVLATISFNEEAEVTNNNLSNKYLFNANGSFSFEFRDEAGNTGSCMASVDWIDRSQPTAKVQLSAEDWTNEDLTVILLPQPNSIIRNVRFNDAPIEEDEFNTYVFGEYGILTYEIYDIQTEIAFEDAVTIKVDNALPMVTSTQYSTESWTNNSVTVTVTANDNLSGVVYKNASTHVFDENGTFTFVIADGAGNEITNTVTVDWIDKSVPIPTVSYFVESNPYDLSSPTNKNVTAVVTFDEGGSPVSITNNEGSAEYVFDINGSFEIMFKDEAGNVGSVTANVSKIDKVAPTGYITYSEAGWTNNDIIATLHTADDVNDVIITNNSGNDCTFTENGEFTFEFKDIAGNTSSVTAVTSRIDKKKPVLSYTLSNEDVTAFSVYVFLTADEEVTITNNSGKTSRQFNSNGEFTFTAKDRAGNTSELTVVVSNISKETTPVKLTYSETNPTNDDVFVTIEPQDGKSYIYLLNNGGQKIRKFSENGEFTFKYKNAAGIEGEAVASVTNIDKVPPLLSVEYSHNIMTSDNVTATFKSDEAVVYPYLIVDNKYIFTENNKIQFPVKDLVGNISNIVVETKLIDNTAPEIKMQNQYCILELGSTFDPLEGTEVSDNNELDGEMVVSGAVDTNQVGDYTITYIAKDKAGNTTEAYKYVTVYDPNTFNVFINGRLSTVSQINSASRNIKIQTINAGGNVLAKILTGKKSVGDFKTKGNIIPLDGEFPSTGYYTIYIRDDERNSRIVYVFIEE
ncbi:MAG: DUF5011 domain-containing protein [Clostridiaceae bacterium]|nr:DUF5011 domain-containing protein [Clostridiaceae bacterium]